MTKIKAQVVSGRNLERIADDLLLAESMVVGNMFPSPELIRGSILADAVEALIAAVYLDGGFEAARELVERQFAASIASAAASPGSLDFKSRIGQWAQRLYNENPDYRVDSVTGPDHDPAFTVRLFVRGKELANASGSSKKTAEQEAARRALVTLGES